MCRIDLLWPTAIVDGLVLYDDNKLFQLLSLAVAMVLSLKPGYHGVSPTTVQAWRTSSVGAIPSHPILV